MKNFCIQKLLIILLNTTGVEIIQGGVAVLEPVFCNGLYTSCLDAYTVSPLLTSNSSFTPPVIIPNNLCGDRPIWKSCVTGDLYYMQNTFGVNIGLDVIGGPWGWTGIINDQVSLVFFLKVVL